MFRSHKKDINNIIEYYKPRVEFFNPLKSRRSNYILIPFWLKAKSRKNENIYPISLVVSTLIILFSEMLTFLDCLFHIKKLWRKLLNFQEHFIYWNEKFNVFSYLTNKCQSYQGTIVFLRIIYFKVFNLSLIPMPYHNLSTLLNYFTLFYLCEWEIELGLVYSLGFIPLPLWCESNLKHIL